MGAIGRVRGTKDVSREVKCPPDRLLAGVLHASSACLDACDAAPNALAWARVRIAALGAVTLLASSEANCAALLSSEPEGVASACVACLRSEAAKHDPLASRTAVTIVRNLALAPANRARLGRVPKLLEVLVSQAVSSRDPNAAGAAAATLRMLVDGCAHNAVVRALPYRCYSLSLCLSFSLSLFLSLFVCRCRCCLTPVSLPHSPKRSLSVSPSVSPSLSPSPCLPPCLPPCLHLPVSLPVSHHLSRRTPPRSLPLSPSPGRSHGVVVGRGGVGGGGRPGSIDDGH